MHARRIADRYQLEFLYMKVISSHVEQEADTALAAGAEIIIARGVQASVIRKCVTIPMVEIMLTGQEMGLLIASAKRMLGMEHPVIAVVGFKNMFCDMSSSNELYGVDLRVCYAKDPSDLEATAAQAISDGADILIGGEVVYRFAQAHGKAGLFLTSGVESIADAFRVAEKVANALEIEKRNTAEFRALLDLSFNGIIKIDREGLIQRTNYFVEKLIGKSEREVIGSPVGAVTGLDPGMLKQVLQEGKEIYSTMLTIRKTAVVTNIAPILIDKHIKGAIISFQEGQRISAMEAELRRDIHQKGSIARNTFDNVTLESPPIQEAAEKAKHYAKFNVPVQILGEEGRKVNSGTVHPHARMFGTILFSLSSDSLPQEKLAETLFGWEEQGKEPYIRNGLVDKAEGGTLFIDRVSRLSICDQYRLYRLVSDHLLIREWDSRPLPAHVRVIASDTWELFEKIQRKEFRTDLFHALNVLPLDISPLRERPEDIRGWLHRYIDEFEHRYDRYIRMTLGAEAILMSLPWPGNLSEIRSFCERLVILSPKRTVDESIVRRLLKDSDAQRIEGIYNNGAAVSYQDEKVAQLRELMARYNGNRSLVAREMKISKTTLWRYLNKYNITEL